MNLEFANRRISGMLTVLPAQERTFLEEMENFNFPLSRSLKLKQVMGYDRHRIVEDGVLSSDLAVHGIQHLIAEGKLDKADVDGLIVITQSPDYLMPSTSSVIQGRLGLKHDMLCLDIAQGCAGFLIGLIEAFLLLEQAAFQKIVLVNVDILSRRVSTRDRNSYPLIGDGAAITIIERSDNPQAIFANLKMDGARRAALMIPAGGFAMPSSAQTAVLEEDAEGNFRAKDHLRMDGTAVFNFVQTEVPPMIEDLMAYASAPIEEVDFFIFHQPNSFMLGKLAERMGVDRARMPSNVVENFGNSSGVTIPLALALNLRERVVSDSLRICFAGFGVGLTWSSMLMNVGPMDFCEMIDYPDGQQGRQA